MPTPLEVAQRHTAYVNWPAMLGPKTMTSGWTDFSEAGQSPGRTRYCLTTSTLVPIVTLALPASSVARTSKR